MHRHTHTIFIYSYCHIMCSFFPQNHSEKFFWIVPISSWVEVGLNLTSYIYIMRTHTLTDIDICTYMSIKVCKHKHTHIKVYQCPQHNEVKVHLFYATKIYFLTSSTLSMHLIQHYSIDDMNLILNSENCRSKFTLNLGEATDLLIHPQKNIRHSYEFLIFCNKIVFVKEPKYFLLL